MKSDPDDLKPERDPSTLLVNWTDFRQLIDYESVRTARDDEPLCLAIIDLDRFADVAQHLGPGGVKQVLKVMGPLLRAHFGAKCMLGYQPLDTFGVLLADTSVEEAVLSLDVLRRRFETNTLGPSESESVLPDPDSFAVALTLSAGLAVHPRDGKDAQTLIRSAKMALLEAKRAGRNRVQLAVTRKMVLKSSYFPRPQLEALAHLARVTGQAESELLREALDLLFDRVEVQLKSKE